MAVIRVIEHQRIAVSDSPQPGEPCISEQQAAALRKIESSLPAGAFEWGHQSIKLSQLCGVIALGSDMIEVLPKIHGKEHDHGSCRKVLVRMLYAAKRLKPSSHGSAALNLQKDDLLEIFILHFCEELTHQLRQGIIRRYVTKTENLPVIRGKLLIGQQLRLNSGHKERVWCQHDELQADNRPNQIIKFVLRLLLRMARGARTQRSITELLYQFESVDDLSAIASDVDSVQLDRTTKRFESTFRFCRWLLTGWNPDVVSGQQSYAALLFDMNRLFEEVVTAKLRPLASSCGLRLRAQGPQKRLVRDLHSDVELFVVRPDITLTGQDGKIKAILDTKWKITDPTQRKMGISQPDLYQIAAYSGRYRCRELALIYPKTASHAGQSPITLDLLGTDARIRICFVDVAKLVEAGHSQQARLWRESLPVLEDADAA